jgi:integrase
VYLRAADSIGDYKPIPTRLLIREPFDYEAEGLPSPARSYLDGLESPDSKRNMGYALDIFAAFLSGGRIGRDQIPWHLLTADHRDEVRKHLLERYAERQRPGGAHPNPLSVNARLIAWRQVLRHAWDKGLMSADAYRRAATVSIAKGERPQRRRFVPEEALATLFRNCALDPNRAAGARDAALMSLLFGCGLRRFEAIALLYGDLEIRDDGWLLSVLGKRNKQRTVGVPIGAAAYLKDWLELRGREPGPLFYPVRQNGVIVKSAQPMTNQVGNQIVDRRLKAAGVPKFSPHDLRATSTTILAGLIDFFQTMDWAGHDDANTTRTYVVAAQNLAQEIAARLHVPHFGESGAESTPGWSDLAPRR